ncbi:HAMP domain-containing histidine kinase [Geobacter pelophilus]|uniref:histidine kinase n=1 Tax=Geoanaerobacter pelophilus TaxID=60036 RepID=A0AAW4KXA3_9BACT|nr:HAMP domain-containing sensor histidine kinase [Geoanaerobacter pelophilus]MBT0663258.1 HAMP domain-containing histidine kinase [Geoanaerobacter pelophilus]
MRWYRKLFSPIITFIGIQLVWIMVVIFWIYWFVGRHKEFREIAERYRPEIAARGLDWIVLVEGLILLIVILAGVYVLFLVWRRQSTLYREQKNFISQVTHELKSPLASIQLHLETIRLRKPPPEKMERFLDTMLADTDRLHALINNLLMAARLEDRRRSSSMPVIDFSEFVSQYLEKKRSTLPEGGSLILEVEEHIQVAVDSEEMESVLRNLFENALLYSPVSPEIKVELKQDKNQCQLTFRDNGIGIDQKNLKKIFRMFFRVRRLGENIRGTGLGLYIVKQAVTEHGGTVTAESAGQGKGCAFIIRLPIARNG